MKFIHLDKRETRCRPEKPNTILHNDCGMQSACARRVAANTVGAPEMDLSRDARSYVGNSMLCPHYMSQELAAEIAAATKV